MAARTRLVALKEHARTPLYRDAYALIIANVLTSVFGIAYWALAARLFAPAELGLASVLISQLIFLSAITQFNARVALLRFLPVTGRKTARFVVVCYAAAGIGGAALGTFFVLGLSGWMHVDYVREFQPAVWFVISIALWSYFNLQDGLLTGLGKAPIVPLENGLYGAAKLGLLIILGGWAGQAAIFLSWTLPAAILVVVISIYAALRLIPRHVQQTEGRTPRMTAGTMVRFLALDYVASLASTMTATLLPIVVVASAGAATGAFFYIPWVMVTTLSLVPLYLSASLTVQASGDRDRLGILARRTLVQMGRMLLPIVVGVVAGAPLLLSLFGGTYADEGSGLLRVASLGVLPFGLNVLFLAVARVQGRGRAILGVQVFLTVVTLGLSFVLLPQLGIIGVGVAWLTANGAASVIVGWLELRPLLLATRLARA